MKKVFWLIVSSVAMISCNNNSSSQKQENEATEKVATTASSRNIATGLSDETIVLNNGESRNETSISNNDKFKLFWE